MKLRWGWVPGWPHVYAAAGTVIGCILVAVIWLPEIILVLIGVTVLLAMVSAIALEG